MQDRRARRFIPHGGQHEFVYVPEGHPTLHTDEGVVYLEVGDRTPGDEGSYPDDDLVAARVGRMPSGSARSVGTCFSCSGRMRK